MYQEAPLNQVLIILFLHFAEDRGQLNHGLLRERVYLLAATIVGAVGQQAFAQHLFYYISLYLNDLKHNFPTLRQQFDRALQTKEKTKER